MVLERTFYKLQMALQREIGGKFTKATEQSSYREHAGISEKGNTSACVLVSQRLSQLSAARADR
jgi:hypothetical protein